MKDSVYTPKLNWLAFVNAILALVLSILFLVERIPNEDIYWLPFVCWVLVFILWTTVFVLQLPKYNYIYLYEDHLLMKEIFKSRKKVNYQDISDIQYKNKALSKKITIETKKQTIVIQSNYQKELVNIYKEILFRKQSK